MLDAGRSPGSIQYALAVVRQVFNYAIQNRLFDGRNPADKTGGVKRPKVDNRRTRFLTKEEAKDLLAELKKRSIDVYDMSLFSLNTGARAGELFNLRLFCLSRKWTFMLFELMVPEMPVCISLA